MIRALTSSNCTLKPENTLPAWRTRTHCTRGSELPTSQATRAVPSVLVSEKFDEAVKRFADHGRRVSARAGRTKRRTTAHRRRSAEIRAWAKRSGMEVSDRGRIPAEVISQYEANH